MSLTCSGLASKGWNPAVFELVGMDDERRVSEVLQGSCLCLALLNDHKSFMGICGTCAADMNLPLCVVSADQSWLMNAEQSSVWT